MKRSFIISLFILPHLTIFAQPSSFFDAKEISQQINYHNRPLIKVNGKTISLVDVIKKMDLQILKNSPHLIDDVNSKHQYYSANWRNTFNELVENELILIDSEPLKFAISEADIREELETTLGNNLISKLDQIGMTLIEAKKITENDLIIRQMLWFKAYSKAVQGVTPEMIKSTYTELVKRDSMKKKEQWCYQVLTVKCIDQEKGLKIAEDAYNLMNEKTSIIADIPSILKTSLSSQEQKNYEITLSKELTVDSSAVSKTHFDVLSNLQVNEISKPLYQKTRNNNESVHRIFILKDHTKESVQAFEVLATEIKDKLIQMAAEKEKKSYVDTLKQRFFVTDAEIQEVIPKEYEPFALL